MRVGLVSFWFNRGQAFVTRAVRSIFRDAGHETFVLARPDKLKGRVRTDDVWAEDGVEVASGNAIRGDEYLDWARRNRIEVCFFDQNEQFDEIAALRRSGVVTVGRYVWEKFLESDVARAREAFDCLYSLTRCETERYARLGLLTPRLQWGCWPEIASLSRRPKGPGDDVVFYYPAGYLEIRRAVEATVKAFVSASPRGARLVVKSTKPLPEKRRVRHPQVEYRAADMDRAAYLEFLAGCDVVLSNTRWEGLGLVFYEAIALGLPLICPDFPPMNENVRDGLTGLLVACSTRKRAPSGIPAADTRHRALVAAIRRMADRGEVERLSRNVLRMRDFDYRWERTRGDYLALLALAAKRGADRGS